MQSEYLRLSDIIGRKAGLNPKRCPAKVGLIPVSASTWHLGVKEGRFPAPIKVGKLSIWRRAEVMAILERK